MNRLLHTRTSSQTRICSRKPPQTRGRLDAATAMNKTIAHETTPHLELIVAVEQVVGVCPRVRQHLRRQRPRPPVGQLEALVRLRGAGGGRRGGEGWARTESGWFMLQHL